MTRPSATRTGRLSEFTDILTTVAVPHHEGPAVILRRRIIVAVVMVIGACCLAIR